MTSTYFGDLFDEAESGVAAASVPTGDYDVVVTDARARAQSSIIFLTFQVLNGPAQGKEAEVSLYFPTEDAKRGARIYFARKIAGLIAYPDVKAAFQAADNAPSVESGFEHIAGTLIGKQVKAELSLRTDGDYAGSNELKSTKSLAGAPAPAATPAAAPAQTVPVQPAAESASTGVPF